MSRHLVCVLPTADVKMAETTPAARLDVWDYVSMTCLLVLSSVAGLYHIFTARKSKVTKDFLVTSKDLGLFPLILSSVATFFSAIGMIAFPNEIYLNGLCFSLIIYPVLVFAPIGSHLYLPVFFKLNRNTIFEYLELRFCKALRICTSLMLTAQTLIYTAVVMYVPALALNQVTGLHLWASVVSIGIVCIIYTSMGGIKAVVWADVAQCLVMIAMVTLIITKSTIDIGGLSVIWERITEGKRDEIFIWSSSPHTRYSFWTFAIANPVHMIALLVVNQSLMQRYLSNATLKRAQISFIGGTIGVSIGHVIIVTEGILMYAYYYNCDPVLSGKVKLRDQSMALFAVEILSFCKGLAGIFVAGVMSATLSTLSSMLNSLSSITLTDYVKCFKPDLSDETSMKLSRYLVVIYGVVCIALVALAENLGSVVQVVIGLSGTTGGSMLAVFTMGMLLPWVNSKGAIAGFVASFFLPMWAWIGSFVTSPYVPHAPLSIEGCLNNRTTIENVTVTAVTTEMSPLDQFYAISPMWYDVWGLAIALIVSLIVSKLTGFQDPMKVDADLLFPFVKNYFFKGDPPKESNHFELDKSVGVNGHVIQPLLLTNTDAEF